jgi:hypothetical protein
MNILKELSIDLYYKALQLKKCTALMGKSDIC